MDLFTPTLDWGSELTTSLWWIAKAWLIAAVSTLVVLVAIGRFTVWGRQFWRITGGYFVGGSLYFEPFAVGIGAYDLEVRAVVLPLTLSPSAGYGNLTLEGTYRFLKDPEVDKLLAEGAATVDQAKRKEIYQKMQEITRHDLPYLPIFQYKMVEGIKEGLQNFVPNVSVQENCWNAGQWYWAS